MALVLIVLLVVALYAAHLAAELYDANEATPLAMLSTGATTQSVTGQAGGA